jgi:phage/plasmid-like protein (TIGR03299 family)
MAHHFTPGQGFFVRQPSWHQLESKILADWPTSWDEARVQAGLNLWEPVSVPIYELVSPVGYEDFDQPKQVEGYQRIIRSDNRLTLGIQTKKYRMITNSEFGGIIETVLGAEINLDTGECEIKYEGVFELYEGRQVFAVVYLGEGIQVPGDNSLTYRYAVFSTRHDGQGGVRCVITNVRVVCANTAKMSEAGAKEEETSFTIRHAGNWDERVAEVRDKVADALQANQRYFELCTQLATAKITPNTMEKMIKRLLPVGDDMGVRQQLNRENEREVLRTLLKGPTIATEHQRTPYGFLMAATEWSDHYRGFRTASSYVTRQLTSKEPIKVRAFGIAKQFAGVK